MFSQTVGSGGDGKPGCDQRTVEVCVVDECGNDLVLPYERLSQLDVVMNNSTNLPTQVLPPDENGCVTLVYSPPYGANVFNIRVVWSFQQGGCPETHLDCTPEEFTFGIDHEIINGPRCNESITMTLSNYTRRNVFSVRTDNCQREVLNRLNHTVEICGDDPTLFLEVKPGFLGNYQMGVEIIDNQVNEDGNNPVLENRLIPCFDGSPGSQAELNGLFGIKAFDCGEDDEGNPIFEFGYGIDITDYLTADPTCEEPTNITLSISLFCCGDNESFVNLSYTFIWQPDVTIPDPLFYFSTGNFAEAQNNGTQYDNGNQTDNLLINYDNDPTQFTGNGPILGRVSLGLTFVEEIANSACVEKFTVEFFEFSQCDVTDWTMGTPMSYDDDDDPETPEISVFDVTGEITEDGYTVSLFDLPTNSDGSPVILFDRSSCYYVKVTMYNKCGDIFEEFGRFETSSCPFCRLVQEDVEPLEAKVYPSVVQDIVNIKLSRNSITKTEVSIFNLSGRQVEQRVFDSNKTHFEINTLNAPSGMYFIQIKSGNFEKVSKIFVQN